MWTASCQIKPKISHCDISCMLHRRSIMGSHFVIFRKKILWFSRIIRTPYWPERDGSSGRCLLRCNFLNVSQFQITLRKSISHMILKASLRFGKISIVFEDLSRNSVFFEPKWSPSGTICASLESHYPSTHDNRQRLGYSGIITILQSRHLRWLVVSVSFKLNKKWERGGGWFYSVIMICKVSLRFREKYR